MFQYNEDLEISQYLINQPISLLIDQTTQKYTDQYAFTSFEDTFISNYSNTI